MDPYSTIRIPVSAYHQQLFPASYADSQTPPGQLNCKASGEFRDEFACGTLLPLTTSLSFKKQDRSGSKTLGSDPCNDVKIFFEKHPHCKWPFVQPPTF